MRLKKTSIATTALVLCISASVAAQEPGKPGARSVAPFGTAQADQRHDVIFSNLDKNAQFLSWFGYRASRNASTVLYEQSASSGFSTYAISSWALYGSAACSGCTETMAADDFVIPGKGKYQISAVYAPGMTFSNAEPFAINITFYEVLKYSEKTGKTTIVTKATCNTQSFKDTSGHGNFLADVSSCNLGKFKGGHDYSVNVQPWFNSFGHWAWQTNKVQIKRQAFFVGYGWTGPCRSYFRPVKTCFPETGYGPDLAFAIYGTQR